LKLREQSIGLFNANADTYILKNINYLNQTTREKSDFVGAVFAGQKEWLNQQRRSNEREQN
jgi:hypothetical protein